MTQLRRRLIVSLATSASLVVAIALLDPSPASRHWFVFGYLAGGWMAYLYFDRR